MRKIQRIALGLGKVWALTTAAVIPAARLTPVAHADTTASPLTQSQPVLPVAVDLIRALPGNNEDGHGINRRANRLYEGDLITDIIRITPSLIGGGRAEQIEVHGYYSAATLEWVGWEGPSGAVLTPRDGPFSGPQHYRASLSLGEPLTGRQELKLTFRVKPSSIWPKDVLLPQAEHSIDYGVVMRPGLLPQLGKDRLHSDVYRAENGYFAASVSTRDMALHRENAESTVSTPRFSTRLASGFTYEHVHLGVSMGTMRTEGSTDPACETRLTADTAHGIVSIKQGTCRTGDANRYPFLTNHRENRFGDQYISSPYGIGGMHSTHKIFWRAKGNPAGDLLFQVWNGSGLIAEISVPRSQMLQIVVQDGQNYTPGGYFWNNGDSWKFLGELYDRDRTSPIADTRFANKIIFRDDREAIYLELPNLKPE